jgi:DNA repair exonuclease SbcCD nuclease subunit
VRIIHAADLHIDSQFDGLSAALSDHAAADLISGATRSAFRALVDWALVEQPDAMVLAGDIFDGAWKSTGTRRVFLSGMTDLADAGIPVFMASGNHDAESVLLHDVVYPDSLHVFPVHEPRTFELPDAGLAFHGQGYATPAVEHSLAREYPAPLPGLVNVGVLHANVGATAGHRNYSPCTADDLRALEYEYVALGHIHGRREFVDGDRVFAAYSGNLQGRSARETGAKGALMIDFADPTRPDLMFRPLDVLRWEFLDVEAATDASVDDVLDAVAVEHSRARDRHAGTPLVLRTRISAMPALAAQLRVDGDFAEQVRDVTTGSLLEKVTFTSLESDEIGPPVDAELRAEVQAAAASLTPADVTELLAEVRMRARGPLKGSEIDLSSGAYLASVIERAGEDLLSHLSVESSGGDS